MGSFISCTSASKALSPPPPPPPPPPVMAHSLVARVLLVDGSVIHFTRPVKVIRLLLDHPDHFICPLDSLRPGHHSLSSLLPDEELQLGHLYLLLPFQTFEKRRDGVPKNHGGEEGMLHAGAHHNGNNNIVQRQPARETGVGKRGGDGAPRLLARDKSSDLRTSTKHKGPVPHVGHLSHTSRSSSAQASDYNDLHERRSASHASSYINIRSSSTRLCDTPELQKAYRSDMLRRCRTWTPRLQAITETSRNIGAGNNS